MYFECSIHGTLFRRRDSAMQFPVSNRDTTIASGLITIDVRRDEGEACAPWSISSRARRHDSTRELLSTYL